MGHVQLLLLLVHVNILYGLISAPVLDSGRSPNTNRRCNRCSYSHSFSKFKCKPVSVIFLAHILQKAGASGSLEAVYICSVEYDTKHAL